MLFFYLVIVLYFLIHTAITKIFNPSSELAIPIAITTNKARWELKTQLVTVETKISKISV